MGFFDKLRRSTKKERNGERMQKIRESGKEGERHFEQDNAFSKIEKVHHGADYVKTVRDSAGRERKEPHEVKRNNSPLSKLQKKTRGLIVDRYEKTPLGDVHKTYRRNGDEIKQDPLTGKYKKVRKRDSSVFGSLFGSNSSKPTKTTKKSSARKKPKSFSNAESLWGSSSISKPSKKKSTKRKSSNNVGWLGGSSSKSSGKKSKTSSNVDWLLGGNSSSSKKSSKRKSSRSNVDSIWGSSSSSGNIWGSSKGKKFKL